MNACTCRRCSGLGPPDPAAPTFTADNPAAECELCGGTQGQHEGGTLICPTEWENDR